MKRSNMLFALLVGIAMAGCKEAPPPPSAPVETAGQSLERDNADIAKRLAEQKAAVDTNFQAERARAEKTQIADSLAALGKNVGEALDEIGRVTLREIDAPGKKLDVARTELETLTVNDCTTPLRSTLLGVIASAQEVITLYKREKGNASEATREKLQNALVQFDEVARKIPACR